VTIFPGDGFIGGPPCGIIAGQRSVIGKITAHPLSAAVSADKLTLAALGATLRLYADNDTAERSIPALSLLATPLENLRQRAERLAPQITATGVATAEVASDMSSINGSERPTKAMPTITLSLQAKERTAAQLAAALASGTPAVVGRTINDRLILDVRSMMPRDDLPLVRAFQSLASSRDVQPSDPSSAS
jgi:L-seryl-tRNA(Ser) seleniumtransferase